MKKLTTLCLTALLLVLLITAPVAAAASVTFSLKASSSQVRYQDTIVITGSLSATAAVATFDLNITFDPAKLQYVKTEGISPAIRSGELDTSVSSGKVQLLYLDSDGGGSGITSGNAFRLTFKVLSDQVGDKIAVGIQVKTAGDAAAQAMNTSASGTTLTVAAPLSANADLAALSVSAGDLAPAFSKNTTQYSLSVPFSVAKLTVTAQPEDSAAKISINNPSLTAGASTAVTVTVTAAAGNKKTYAIQVKRAQDPNYVPSSNNDLASINVDPGLLSPPFAADRDAYIVYLPYEQETVTVTAAPADSKAQVTVTGQDSLLPDTYNPVTLVCTAENGTARTITVLVWRAMPFTGLDQLLATPTPPPTPTVPAEPSPSPTPSNGPTPGAATATPAATTPEPTGPAKPANPAVSGGVGMLVAILALSLLSIGLIVYILVNRRRGTD
jgi:hypothetical protein